MKAQPGGDAGLPAEDAGEDPDGPDAAAPDRSVKGTWEKVSVHPSDGDPITELTGIFVRGPNDVWTSEGQSNLGTGYYHYDGKAWTGVRYPGGSAALVGLPSGDLFGYGEDLYVKAKSGDAWEAFPQPQAAGGPASVRGLWGSSRSDLYASTATAGNLHFDGSDWNVIASLGTRAGSFTGASAQDVWFSASGYKQLSHYDGSSWTNHWDKLPAEVKAADEGPYGVFATGSDNVWAMGRARTVLHYDGTAWSITPGPDDEWGCDLIRGWASSKKNAWLVGRGGCVFHWDGASWEKIPSGVTEDIFGIHGSDSEHVWIVPYSETTLLRLVPE